MTTSKAMPQGDPFGPIALNCWMGVRTRWVTKECEARERRARSEEEEGKEDETTHEETKAESLETGDGRRETQEEKLTKPTRKHKAEATVKQEDRKE